MKFLDSKILKWLFIIMTILIGVNMIIQPELISDNAIRILGFLFIINEVFSILKITEQK